MRTITITITAAVVGEQPEYGSPLHEAVASYLAECLTDAYGSPDPEGTADRWDGYLGPFLVNPCVTGHVSNPDWFADWQYEVANGDTTRGYTDWCEAQAEAEG